MYQHTHTHTTGFVGSGLSVEQRKRVTIAVEMTANPSILFLDEPTSGLDSRAARIVMRAVRRVAASGRTVVCTIHQPSYEIFSMFDNLLLLKTGGFVVYNGSLGPTAKSPLTGEIYYTAGDLVRYFEGLAPHLPRMGEDKNPAEFMLERAGPIRKEDDPDYVDYVGAYNKSPMAQEIQVVLQQVVPGAPLAMDSRYALPIYKQLFMSLQRWFQHYWRNVAYSFTRILMVIIIAVLFSLASRGVRISEITTQAQVQSFNGAIFAGVLFTAAVQVSPKRLLFVHENLISLLVCCHTNLADTNETSGIDIYVCVCVCIYIYTYICSFKTHT
jgi:energy-coupling factor transporter ATP-binding protein EcfA2